MRRIFLVFAVGLLGGMAFAGCLGGDDARPTTKKEEPTADDPLATATTGSITGQVVTTDLEVVPRAVIVLAQEGDTVGETESDKAGRFTFNGIEPGAYRIQAAAVCCHVGVRDITVAAGEVTDVNFQVARLTPDDLQIPYVVEHEWTGFISCGIGVSVPGVAEGSLAVCALAEGTPAEDQNEEFYHNFSVQRGIRSLVVGMTWQAVGGLSGTEFQFLVENQGCGLSECSYEYARLRGEAPLTGVVSDADITADEWKWAAITEKRELQFRVFANPATLPTLMYQQPFTVYYHEYFWQEAPPEANPIPEG